ncbi:hypothetical protein SK128_000105 [Halocaridina rubra]|uniref:Uncharacterized protein n=1 Tax=Halocaridina rubra TaxID=373956 RepID=A0AAN8XKQ3_HALRR
MKNNMLRCKKKKRKVPRKKGSEKMPIQKVKYGIRQVRMEEYHNLTTTKVWDISHPKTKEIDRYISEMLVMDDLPFSHVEDDELKKIQGQLQLPNLKVVHDSPTRWNSMLHMLRKTAEMKEPLCVYVANNH